MMPRKGRCIVLNLHWIGMDMHVATPETVASLYSHIHSLVTFPSRSIGWILKPGLSVRKVLVIMCGITLIIIFVIWTAANEQPNDLCFEPLQIAPITDLGFDELKESAHFCPLEDTTKSIPCWFHQTAYYYDILDTAARKHNVKWMLSNGALIGAIREGGVILHDHDQDCNIWIDSDEDFANFNAMLDDMVKMSGYTCDYSRNAHTARHLVWMFCHTHRNPEEVQKRRNGGGGKIASIPNSFRMDFFPLTRHRMEYTEDWHRSHDPMKRVKSKKKDAASKEDSSAHVVWQHQKSDLQLNPSMHAVSLWWKNVYDITDIFPLNSCNMFGKAVPCPRKPLQVMRRWYGPKADFTEIRQFDGHIDITLEERQEGVDKSIECLAEHNWPNAADEEAKAFRPWSGHTQQPYFQEDSLCCLNMDDEKSCLPCLK